MVCCGHLTWELAYCKGAGEVCWWGCVGWLGCADWLLCVWLLCVCLLCVCLLWRFWLYLLWRVLSWLFYSIDTENPIMNLPQLQPLQPPHKIPIKTQKPIRLCTNPLKSKQQIIQAIQIPLKILNLCHKLGNFLLNSLLRPILNLLKLYLNISKNTIFTFKLFILNLF